MSTLSEEEKVRIRDHLGFLNSSELSTFVLGLPAGVETQFMIERAMNLYIKESALPMVRQILCELDDLDKSRKAVRSTIGVEAIGGIRMRSPSDAFAELNKEFIRLIGRLANAFGVAPNPFDNRNGTFGIPCG